jgi:predicted heme/steroid binding protein
MTDDWTAAGPEAMRQRLADYVYALHKAYLTHLDLLAPAERAAMPLAGQSQVTVAVAAARDLHLVATTDPLPAPRGPEVELTDEFGGVSWTVRFFDASILPELGIAGAAGDDPVAVRRVLGVADVVYHLSVSPGGGLGAHHAQHAGVALANQHASAIRDGQSVRRAFPGREALVDEFVVAERLGLEHSARLLAREIAGPALTAEDLAGDVASVRKALLRVGKGTT